VTDENMAKKWLAELREGNPDTRDVVNEWKQKANESSALYLSENGPYFLAMFTNYTAYENYKTNIKAKVNWLIEPTYNGYKLAGVPIENSSFSITETSPRPRKALGTRMTIGDLDSD
jgi:hypothetical protein